MIEPRICVTPCMCMLAITPKTWEMTTSSHILDPTLTFNFVTPRQLMVCIIAEVLCRVGEGTCKQLSTCQLVYSTKAMTQSVAALEGKYTASGGRAEMSVCSFSTCCGEQHSQNSFLPLSLSFQWCSANSLLVSVLHSSSSLIQNTHCLYRRHFSPPQCDTGAAGRRVCGLQLIYIVPKEKKRAQTFD